MTLNRRPISTLVNGVAMLVRNPDAASAEIASKWMRVPGLASFTLPDETGSVNETQLQDGAVSAANIAGVGTVTGNIGAITGHATHRLLAAKRRASENNTIEVTIIRPAGASSKVAGTDAKVALATQTTVGGVAKLTVDADMAARNAVKGALKEGILAAVGVGTTVPAHAAFRPVYRVNDDGSAAELEATTAVTGVPKGTTTTDPAILYTRTPGFLCNTFTCTVNGFGDGDFQAGGHIAANISLAPSVALTINHAFAKTLSSELSMSSEYNGVFADIT